MKKHLLIVALTVGAIPLNARAELIYCKNGTRFEGKILSQTNESIKLQPPGENEEAIDIPKISIENKQPPSGEITLLLGLSFPGGGQLYLGEGLRALYYFGVTSLTASLGYKISTQIYTDPASPNRMLGAVYGGLVPMIVGAFDARRSVEIEAKENRLHIDYSR